MAATISQVSMNYTKHLMGIPDICNLKPFDGQKSILLFLKLVATDTLHYVATNGSDNNRGTLGLYLTNKRIPLEEESKFPLEQ